MTTQYARFWDNIAPKYAKKPVPDQAVYEQKLRWTQQQLDSSMKVFEFGCGTGSTALAHAPFVAHITATDFSEKMISIAKDKQEAAGINNVEFVRSSIEGFTDANESFDVVMGMSILHLLEDPEAAIRKANQLLKPGGLFITSTACIQDFFKVFKLIAPIGRFFRVLPYVQVFSSQHLKQAMTKNGFVIDREWLPSKASGLFLMARKPK